MSNEGLRTEFAFSHGEAETNRGSATVTIENGGSIPSRMALNAIAYTMVEMGISPNSGAPKREAIEFTIDSGVQNWKRGPDGRLQDGGMTGYRVTAEPYNGGRDSNADFVGRIEEVRAGRVVDVDYFSANVEPASGGTSPKL